jgi:hypothetical protein
MAKGSKSSELLLVGYMHFYFAKVVAKVTLPPGGQELGPKSAVTYSGDCADGIWLFRLNVLF